MMINRNIFHNIVTTKISAFLKAFRSLLNIFVIEGKTQVFALKCSNVIPVYPELAQFLREVQRRILHFCAEVQFHAVAKPIKKIDEFFPLISWKFEEMFQGNYFEICTCNSKFLTRILSINNTFVIFREIF